MKALRFFIGCIVPIACLCVGCNDNGKPQNDDTSLDTGTARDSSGLTIASDSDTSSAAVPDTTSHMADTLQTDTETGTTGESGDCSGVVCNTPPANQCGTNNGLIVYNATGWCSQGTCHYIPGTVTCDGACINGVCQGSPCQAVLCNSPPAAECLGDTNVLRVYGRNGSCSPLNGTPQCNYTSEDVVCEGGCADGQCIDSPCAHVVCDDPPARYCDGNNLITWNNISRCEAGECIYEAQIVPCVNGCQDGACVAQSACESVTCADPPAPYCADSATLRAFKVAGTCQDGFCFYAPFDVTCATSCEAGQCAGDPCAGVDCSAGPPMYCDADGVTLISWDGLSGTCGGGVCNYGLQTTTCVEGCESGSCRNDPCGGVTCDAPPADYCTGAQSAVQYISPGICVGNGSCAYQSSPVSCPMGCELGICLTGSETGDTDTSTELDTGTVDDTTDTVAADMDSDTDTISDSDTGATPADSDTYTIADTDTEIVLFFEDFEEESSWFADNGLWVVGENSNAPSATQVAATVPGGNYTGTDSRFIGPGIDLPAISAVQVLELRFMHLFRFNGATQGYVQVQESSGTGLWGEWTTLDTGFGSDSPMWTVTMRDLSAYAGSRVRLAFFFDYVDGSANAGWYIDDVEIGVRPGTVSVDNADGYHESFEDDSHRWWADHGLWNIANNSNAPDGEKVAGTNNGGNYTGIDSRLISPTLELPTAATGQMLALRFMHLFRINGATQCYVQVQESIGPRQWGEWTTLETGFGGDSATWTGTMRDLTAYAGSTVRLAFYFDYVDGSANAGWYVDDITIRLE